MACKKPKPIILEGFFRMRWRKWIYIHLENGHYNYVYCDGLFSNGQYVQTL